MPVRPLWLPSISLTLDEGFSIVNWLYQSVSVGLDGFICAVGWQLYVSLRRLRHRYMILLLNVDLPRIVLSVPEGYCAWPIRRLWGYHNWVLPEFGLQFGNHFELSFGDSNRYRDPYCNNVL